MKFHGITLQEGSTVANMTLASGTSFPSNPNEGELFFRSDSDVSVRGMYGYIGGNWDRLASADAITVPSASNFPASANIGDLFYKDSNDANEALYVYTGSAWVATGNSGGTSVVDGDLSGTISIGSATTLTLDSIVTAATAGSASKTVTVTIDAKGRVTSLSEQDIAIAASQVTSGTFDDARIAQTNVTQHQSALNIGASQVTSGTFANARIAQSNVTQHEAALTIAETQITNGSLLARIADNETISGNWAFNGTVSGQTPTSGAHLVTKDYADALATGLDFKQSVKAATTSNITLSGSQTIDGVAISAGMRVLVKDQSNATENGIYVAAAGSWSRSSDADNTPSNEVTAGMFCYVEEGTVNADSGWVLATNDTITLGSTNLVFTQFTGLGQITAGNGLTKTGSTLNVGGNAGRIVVNVDDIDLATVTDSGTGAFKKVTVDSYGRVTGTTDVVSSDITSLVDATYVNVSGDTMTGLLTISRSGNALLATSADPTAANNSGIILNLAASATPASRTATIVLDANGSDGVGGDYVTLKAYGSGDFDINNRNAASILFGTSAVERMRIDSSGNVGIGTNTPSRLVSVYEETAPVIALQNSTTGQTSGDGFQFYTSGLTAYIDQRENGSINFLTNGSERMRLDANGKLLIGPTTALTFGSVIPAFQVRGATAASSWASLSRNSADTNSSSLILAKDRAGGSVVNGDSLGSVQFMGHDGSAYIAGAGMYATIDGTPGTNSMPTRLGFATVPSGSSTSFERVRIDSAGKVGIGGSPGTKLDVVESSASDVIIRAFANNTTGAAVQQLTAGNGTTSSNYAYTYYLNSKTTPQSWKVGTYGSNNYTIRDDTAASNRLTIDTSGNVGINMATSMTYKLEIGASGVLALNDSTNANKCTLQMTAGGLEMYATGSKYIAFGSNSVERVRIDSSGILLVGATSAVSSERARIENTSAGGVPNTLRLTNAGTTAGTGADLSFVSYTNSMTASTIASISGISSDTSGNGLLAFNTSGVERMRIDASGNVGVAVTPVAKLDINGTVAQNIVAMGAVDMNLATGNFFTKTVSGATTFTISNVPASRYVTWTLKLTNGGSATVAWPAAVKWPNGMAPVLTASGKDILSFFSDDGGTTVYGVLSAKDIK